MNIKEYIEINNPDVDFLSLTDEEYKKYYRLYTRSKEIKAEKAFINKIREDNKKQILKDKEERKDKGKPRLKYKQNLPPKYKAYIARANKKGLEFKLSIEEFFKLISGTCSYCGSEASTIDRIDSKQGYTIENCTPCCCHCNTMKWSYSVKDFKKQVERIYHYMYN